MRSCVTAPVLGVCGRWEVNATAVGLVTDTKRLRVLVGDDVVGDMPVEALVDACPTYDAFGATSCVDLVGSLAARMGVAAGVAVVFMEAVAAGLLRTAWLLEGQRDPVEARGPSYAPSVGQGRSEGRS